MFYRVAGPQVDEPNVELLEPFLAAFEDGDHATGGALRALDDRLSARGFVDPVCYAVGDDGACGMVQAVWRHASGDVLARALIRIPSADAPREASSDAMRVPETPDLITPFADGSFLLSTAAQSNAPIPEDCVVNRFIGASEDVLRDAHHRKVRALGREVQRLECDEDVFDTVESYHRMWRECLLEENVFQEPSDSESSVSEPEDSTDWTVLAEMRRQSEKQSSSGTALLIISIILFVAGGSAAWDLSFVALLVPIILFHEAGHFVAMKLFGYRNLKMFFIPLFGAAVSGQQYNVPGWKQVVVSLAGPVPGIVLGGVLWGVSVFWPHEYLQMAIVQLVLINALNLLPILPLDGGWIAQALVFSRHPWLSAAFNVLAIGALFSAGYLLGSFILPILGLVMLIALPVRYRVERLGRKLRKEGLASQTGDDTIPDETGLRIIRELRTELPRSTSTQNLATMALNTFERINARPPGIFATLLLGGVHAASFVGAFIIAVLAIAGAGWLGQFQEFQAAVEAHKGDVACGGIRRFPEVPDAEAPRKLLVASFEDAAAAEATFRRMEPGPRDQSELLLGRTIVAGVVDGAPDLLRAKRERLESNAVHVFQVQEGLSATLICKAPDAKTAAAVREPLSDHFMIGSSAYPIPPWSPIHEISRKEQARRTLYRRYTSIKSEAYNDPRVQAVWDSAEEIGDVAYEERLKELARIQEKARKVADTVVAERRAALREELAEDERKFLDAVDEFEQALEDGEPGSDYQATMTEFGRCLGQLPLDGKRPSTPDLRFSCLSGSVTVEERTIRLNFNVAERGEHLLPAAADYLCRQGCRLTAYEITPQLPDP